MPGHWSLSSSLLVGVLHFANDSGGKSTEAIAITVETNYNFLRSCAFSSSNGWTATTVGFALTFLSCIVYRERWAEVESGGMRLSRHMIKSKDNRKRLTLRRIHLFIGLESPLLEKTWS
jgi:hypothetical protein